MPLYLSEKELAKLQTQATPTAAQPKAKAPRAAGERTGLTTLLQAGWNNEYNSRMEMRLYRGDKSTQFYADEADAVRAAREIA